MIVDLSGSFFGSFYFYRSSLLCALALASVWICLLLFKRGVGDKEVEFLGSIRRNMDGIMGTRYGCYDGRTFGLQSTIFPFLWIAPDLAGLSLAIVSPVEGTQIISLDQSRQIMRHSNAESCASSD